MVELNELSPTARSAAMRGGVDGWGVVGGTSHILYIEPMSKKSRKNCHCGCKTRQTHIGMANGVALISGCEMHIRRWVKRLSAHHAQQEPS